MKKVARIGLITLFLATFSFIPAHAATVTASGDATGLCTLTVDNNASVSVTRSFTECIVTFAPTTTTTYSWTRPTGITSFRILVIAGGGGGGANYGAGGGAGGFIDTTVTASTSTISITVGQGGLGAQSNGGATSAAATNGSNSSFIGSTTHTAIGGGYGGSSDLSGAGNGGSGGGGGGTSGSGGTGTASQGFAGGTTSLTGDGKDVVNSAGGGGAGAAGITPTVSSTVNGGNGGIGKISNITGSDIYYAGGGGGGSHRAGGTCGTNGTGGTGGGGNAANCITATTGDVGAPGSAGTNGLGGGGGGAAVNQGRPSNADGGAGGSGVVIVRCTADFAPVITGPGSSSGSTSSISITENSTSVFTFSANETVTWSLSGSDSATFTINSSGVLVTTSKDFEAPTDANTDNVYVVIVQATDSAALVTTQTVSITVTNLNETATINAPTITGSAYKGVQITISVSLNVPGKVRFFVNNKRVPNCLAVPTTGAYPSVTATCNWKPMTRGYLSLTAAVTPTNITFSGGTSAANRYFILNKSTTR
jgi:hypothetical protein